MAARRRTRRVAAIDGTGHGCIIKQPIPDVEPGQVLVKVRAATISPGSELPAARAARAADVIDPGTPRPIGYQNSGDVAGVGADVTQFKNGDRVACFGGGYALITDYAVVPQNLCCKLPDAVSYEDGAYGNVILTALQAIRRGAPVLGERLLVVGMGIVGQFAAQLGRVSGMDVMTWDRVAFRNRLAQRCGGTNGVTIGRQDAGALAEQFTGGDGFDMAIMAFGGDGTEALRQVVKVMRLSPDGHHMGRVVLVGGLVTECRWGDGHLIAKATVET